MVMVMSFTANVLQPVFGYMMDKYNFNKLMPFLIPFGAVFICMTSWVNEFWAAGRAYRLERFGSIHFSSDGEQGLISKVAPEGKLSSSISIFVAGGSLGFAFSPILLVYFMEAFDLKYLPVLILPAFVLGFFMYSSGLSRRRFVNEQVAKNMALQLQPSV